MENNNIKDLVSEIRTNYLSAIEKGAVGSSRGLAEAVRSALEGAVKSFWQKKYDDDDLPIIMIRGKKVFCLDDAMSSDRFTPYFNLFERSDMRLIGWTCDDVLHGFDVFTVDIANETLNRLEKCIEAIERAKNTDVVIRPFLIHRKHEKAKFEINEF